MTTTGEVIYSNVRGELRLAWDDRAYSQEEFLKFYGLEDGRRIWEERGRPNMDFFEDHAYYAEDLGDEDPIADVIYDNRYRTHLTLPSRYEDAQHVAAIDIMSLRRAFLNLQQMPLGPCTEQAYTPFKWWLFAPLLPQHYFDSGIFGCILVDKDETNVHLLFRAADSADFFVQIVMMSSRSSRYWCTFPHEIPSGCNQVEDVPAYSAS